MRELLPIQEIESAVPFFRGKFGNALARWIKKIFVLSRLEKLIDDHSDKTGFAFTQDVLDDLGIDYELGGLPLEELPEGAFVTIHNHPYGGVDGCSLVNIFGRVDPSYKIMVNKVLARIWPLQDNYITVIPTGEKREAAKAESVSGVRDCITQISAGKPLGVFPSGAVSDLSLKEKCVRDREWQEAAIKLIKRLKVPIVPVRFFDGNSRFYYNLGLISWKIRLLRLPAEVFNKHGKRMRIGIGPVISPEKQAEFSDLDSFKAFLRASVYEMPEPESYVRRSELPETILRK